MRETFDLARGAQKHLPRNMAMKVDKLGQNIFNEMEENRDITMNPLQNLELADTKTESEKSTSNSPVLLALPSTSSGTTSETILKTEEGINGQIDIPCDLLPPEIFKKYQCALCSKRYADKRTFSNYVESHTGKSYTCPKCPSRIFLNAQAYKKHADWHLKGEVYHVCNECGKGFEFKYRLTTHLISHTTVELHCTIDEDCQQTFKTCADPTPSLSLFFVS